MPRPPRAFYPDCVIHATSRGNNRGRIFEDDSDRQRFLWLLRAACKRFGVTLYAYCLMANHFHILAKSRDGKFDAFMHALLRTYARWFNRKRQRTGHLFEDRYYSRLITDDEYLHEAGRYIHMNPVEAGIVGNPEDYAWSSFRQHQAGEGDGLVDVGPLTAPFRLAGRFDAEGFRRFTMERRPAPEPPAPAEPPEAIPALPPGWLDTLASHFGVTAFDILRGAKASKAARARSVAMLVVFEELHCSQRTVARLFGVSERASVCRSIRHALAARAADLRLLAACDMWAAALRQHC